MGKDSLYDEDFVMWTQRQAGALREAARHGSNLPVDFDHLAEEIEDLGKRDRREVESWVGNILEHLIKLRFSPAAQPRAGWIDEVQVFRRGLRRSLRDSPSLLAALPVIVEDELHDAIRAATRRCAEHGETLPGAGEIEAEFRPHLPRCVTDDDWLPSGIAPPTS